MNNPIIFYGLIACTIISVVVFLSIKRSLNNKKDNLNQQILQQQLAQLKAYPEEQKSELELEISHRFLQIEQQMQHSQRTWLMTTATKSPYWQVALLTGLALLAVSIGYVMSGRYQYVLQEQQAFQQAMQQRQTSPQRQDDYIIAVQNKLRNNPNDGDNWFELGQAYAQNNEYDNALESFSRALKLNGEKAYILSAAATTLYYQKGQKVTEQVKQWLERALAQDPLDSAALLLLATESFAQQDYAQAIYYWQTVLDSHRSVDRKAIIHSLHIAETLQRAKK